MRWTTRLSLLMALFAVLIASAFALPAGPRVLNEIQDQRLLTFPAQSNDAVAGNITELTFNTWTITRTWQGYYGNVTGTITLADQYNNTLYDWSNTNPNGRVYASRVNNVDWTTIACATKHELNIDEANFSDTETPDRNGIYPIDSPNGTFVNSSDYIRGDGVTNYNIVYANYPEFYVGPVQINGTGEPGECFSTVMDNATSFVNGQPMAGNDAAHWREVALADGNGDGNIVYASILEQNYPGFDGRPHDFEMLVAENGHGTDIAITTYYFYVELE